MVRPHSVVRAPFLDVALSFVQGPPTVVVQTGRCPQSIVGSNGLELGMYHAKCIFNFRHLDRSLHHIYSCLQTSLHLSQHLIVRMLLTSYSCC